MQLYRIIDIKVFGILISVYRYAYISVSVLQYRKTNIPFGGEIMCHGEESMCHGVYHGRRFLTKEEKIKKLDDYKKWLDNESKGVEEAISKLKAS